MRDYPISFIDSGSGGLSVWKEVASLLPHESTIYFGDHAYLPYSYKSYSFIRQRIIACIRWFIKKHTKLVVIACNTATVAGIAYYRSKFPELPIVGVVPVVKTGALISKKKRFAILSTGKTSKSQYQKQLIAQYANDCTVFCIGSTKLVLLIEKNNINKTEIQKELREIIKPILKKDIDVLALGCTHFPFVKDEIRVIVGKGVSVIDSGEAVAHQVKRILQKNATLANKKKPVYKFFTTGKVEIVKDIYSKLLNMSLEVEYAVL